MKTIKNTRNANPIGDNRNVLHLSSVVCHDSFLPADDIFRSSPDFENEEILELEFSATFHACVLRSSVSIFAFFDLIFDLVF
jgi:hypothetical protein